MAITSKLLCIGIVGVIANGCSQAGQAPVVKSTGNQASLAKSVMPQPPVSDPSKGFGLEDPTGSTTSGSTTTAGSTTSGSTTSGSTTSGSTTTSTSTVNMLKAPKGYWGPPKVAAEMNVPEGYFQYYDAKGTGSDWFGRPGPNNTFTMAKGNIGQNQSPDMSQQFIAQQNTKGVWDKGVIVGADGKTPYAYTAGNNSIVSQGYKLGPNNQPIYNWNAQPIGANSVLQNAKVVPFSTSGYDITAGLTNATGMTYMDAQGKQLVYQPQGAAGTVGVMEPKAQQAALLAGFFSNLFGQQ